MRSRKIDQGRTMGERHSRIRRLISMASFRAAYFVCLVPPVAVLVWAFVDARFHHTADALAMLVRLGPRHTEVITHAWNWQGVRLLVLTSAIVISVAAGAIVVVRQFLGTPQDRSLRCWILATLLAGVCTGAVVGIVRHSDAQVRYRLRRDLWRYQIVADAITAAGKIPKALKTKIGWIRRDTVDTDRFPAYFHPDAQKSVYEEIARIWTLEDQALLFTIYPGRVALEYHPRGTRPRQQYAIKKSGLEEITVPCLDELGDGWFIVKRHR
jgi:hypothetical protein